MNTTQIAFIVVQWENENSVSVVKEKKVVGAVELKEGTTVDILTSTNKGRVAICKATILKVCDVMEPRYKMVKLLVDNLFQGQLIVSPEKKYKQQLSLQFRITSF
ncbi:hypothetical protein pdam_00015871 [Pocillopora damicornis]|uniref:Uncharacterized protein n=1 Tax=Pocillopora damicornis TaxID=46731 RepID=A0A3M6URH3_POCDA|nr:hypothetical protein pdam_00015871 [Pocillopora damicornis]